MPTNADKTVKNAREALRLALENGWTVKETSAHTMLKLKTIQNATHKFGVTLAYGGHGPRPDADYKTRNESFLGSFNTQPAAR